MLYIYASRWILPQSPIGGRAVARSRGKRRESRHRRRERVRRAGAAAAGSPGIPHVRVTAAMSSSPDGPPRTLPALARIWDGVIEPFSADKLAEQSDVVFLALPEEAAATIAPALVDRGVRVIDLSGAFRLRDAAAREKWYPATKLGALKPVYGLTERNYDAIRGRAAHHQPGLLPDGRAARARAAGRSGTAGRRGRHRREVGHLGRRQEAERPDAFLREPRQRVGLRRVRPPASARNRAGAGRAGHVRAAPGAARPGHSRDDLRAACGRARRRARWPR